MSEAETRIAEWIWANPWIGSMKLVKMCEANYGWKQSTVYTMLARMRKKGVLINDHAALTMAIDRQAYYEQYAKILLDQYWQGSLYAFVSCCVQDGIDVEDAGRLIHLIRMKTKQGGSR
ncbi:MAG: BlaI/MecI/CopY family transcriptional regulator [Lactimicrobium sp.]|uniref:BlaI/MecI/CopY family transcriptional regulator n=1 Tax=Lactimicrobium sp. TaxID=2563780 RepID=UPI002F3593EE